MMFPDRIKSIRAGDRVLEIGPGGAPHPRSDAFLELNFDSEEEEKRQRGNTSKVKLNKPVFYYDGRKFPFKDAEFDYVICSQVLEHVYNPEEFLSELSRVAARGYIEYPTIYYDYLYNFRVHKNFLMNKNGVIVWLKKSDTALDDFYAVNKFFYKTLETGFTMPADTFKDYFFDGFEWSGRIGSKKAGKIGEVCLEITAATLLKRSVPPGAKSFASKVRSALAICGSLVKKMISARRFDLNFIKQYKSFKASLPPARGFVMSRENLYPCLNDATGSTGFDAHYIYHPAWAARILKKIAPEFHVDISSTLNFCAIVSAFVPVKFYDYRPANLKLDGLSSGAADLLALPFESSSVRSLSCMHVVEHIGLGRYGDNIDPDGDLKAIGELKRVLADGGDLLFAVPVGGEPQICFNAHRIYSYDQIISYFAGFELKDFSLVPDDAAERGLIAGASKMHADAQKYGCGCFWFKKIKR